MTAAASRGRPCFGFLSPTTRRVFVIPPKRLVAALVLAGLLGCSEGDPNRNLKPVDPNAPKPKRVSDGQGGAPGEKQAPVIK
jgi:hypothetical protein